jgi:predicted PurR-regulated permease PerM
VDALDAYADELLDALLAALQSATAIAAPEPPPVDTIIQALGAALTTTFGAAASLIGGVVSTAVLLLFTFLASIHMSLSAHTYRAACLRAMPAAYRPELAELLARIVRVWNGFFRRRNADAGDWRAQLAGTRGARRARRAEPGHRRRSA